MVYPANTIPEYALHMGVPTIEINTETSPTSPFVDVFIQGKAQEILPSLVNMVLRGEVDKKEDKEEEEEEEEEQ